MLRKKILFNVFFFCRCQLLLGRHCDALQYAGQLFETCLDEHETADTLQLCLETKLRSGLWQSALRDCMRLVQLQPTSYR